VKGACCFSRGEGFGGKGACAGSRDDDGRADGLWVDLESKGFTGSAEGLRFSEGVRNEVLQRVEVVSLPLNEGGVQWTASPEGVCEWIRVLRSGKLLTSFGNEFSYVNPKAVLPSVVEALIRAPQEDVSLGLSDKPQWGVGSARGPEVLPFPEFTFD